MPAGSAPLDAAGAIDVRSRANAVSQCTNAGPVLRGVGSGPRLGPQLGRHNTAQNGLSRRETELKTACLNWVALAWQARGPGFESPMLHPSIVELDSGTHLDRVRAETV